MRALFSFVSLSVLVALVGGCGNASSSSSGGADDGGGRSDVGTPSPGLQCSSFTLCTYAEVMTYATTIVAASGGTVSPGLYRLAWVEASAAKRAGIPEDLTALEIRGSEFIWTGGVEGYRGTFGTANNELTFHYTGRCELGAQTDTDDRTVSYRYTANATELRLHETISGSDGWEQVMVFVRMSDASDACALVPEVPKTPGSSAQCNASNCFCTFATGGTLDKSSCPF
jgi:hypothetical protein